jgi:hypothetical protein
VLLFCTSLGAVVVALDPPCILRISHIVTWWFILGNHQDPTKDGT